MNFGKEDKNTGKYIIAGLDSHKLEVVCSGNFFHHKYPEPKEFITATYGLKTWQFLWNNNKILKNRVLQLKSQQSNVIFIMESFFVWCLIIIGM